MKILVTGAGGFIGSNLIAKLLEQNHIVYGIDNFVVGSEKYLLPFKNNKNFTFIEHDINLPITKQYEVDQIYHLASPASPVDFPRIPVEILLTNFLGTKNLLDLALSSKARLLFSSSSECYGETPQKETYWGNVNPTGERSCYNEGKRGGEALIFAYKKQFKADVRVVRIFNTYGPNMRIDDGRVVTSFIVNALRDEPLLVNGDGNQTRCLQFVTDLVEGLISVMQSEYSDGPVNLGSTEQITMRDLAYLIIRLTNSKSKIKYIAARPDDPKSRMPDITLAQKLIDFKHKIGLDEGLLETIKFLKHELEIHQTN